MPDEHEVRSWETIERGVAHQCEAFDVVTETVRLPDGTQSRFDYVVEPPSVVVLGFTMAGEVIVVDEYRHAVDRVALGLPGGSVEPSDDDLVAAARRELREETGYRASDIAFLFAAEPANGLLNSTRYYHRATGCRPMDEPDRDRDETMRVREIDFDHLVDATLAGDVRDERTVAAVLFEAARRRRMNEEH